MIHYRPDSGPPPGNGNSAEASNRHRATIEAMEASLSQLRRAKRAADDSLHRAQDAPGPHTSDNSIFVGLWEGHLADREALFAAMRRLDDAREALRSSTAGTGPGEASGKPDDRRLAG